MSLRWVEYAAHCRAAADEADDPEVRHLLRKHSRQALMVARLADKLTDLPEPAWYAERQRIKKTSGWRVITWDANLRAKQTPPKKKNYSGDPPKSSYCSDIYDTWVPWIASDIAQMRDRLRDIHELLGHKDSTW